MEKRVAARAAKIEQDEREKARGSVSLEIKDLKNQLAEVLKQRDAAERRTRAKSGCRNSANPAR